MFGKALLALVVLLLLVGGGLGVLAYQARQVPPVVAALPTVEASAQAAERVDEKLAALSDSIAEARQSGKKRDVEITLTEEELTSEAARLLAKGGTGVEDVENLQVHVTEAALIASGTVDVQGLRVPVAATMRIDAVAGRPQVVVEQVDLGAVPLPATVKDRVKAMIASSLDLSQLELPLEVKAIRLEEGRVVVQGQTK